MNVNWSKNSFIYLLIGVAVLAIFLSLFNTPTASNNIPISSVIDLAKKDQITSIEVAEDSLRVTDVSGRIFKSRKEPSANILTLLSDAGVDTSSIDIDIKLSLIHI